MVLPYLKGLLYIFGVIVCDCLWFYYSRVLLYLYVKSITSGIRTLFKAKWNFFWVYKKFEENYWAATFSVSSENLGVEYVENN